MRAWLVGLAVAASVGLARPAGAEPPVGTSTDSEVIDERLRAEEAWAAAEYRRRLRVRDGSTEPPIPPPDYTPPIPGRDWLSVVLAILAGVLWGRWHRRRKRRRQRE